MADKRFLAHVATEVVVVFGIVFFFFRQKQRLEQRVAALEETVHKMQETILSLASRDNAPVIVDHPPVNYFPQRRNAVVFATNICTDSMCEIVDARVQEVPFEELISSDGDVVALDDEIAEELSELQVSTDDTDDTN